MGEQPLQGRGPEQQGPLAGTQFPPPDRLSGWTRWCSACPASPLTSQLWKAGQGWLPGKGRAEARAWWNEAGHAPGPGLAHGHLVGRRAAEGRAWSRCFRRASCVASSCPILPSAPGLAVLTPSTCGARGLGTAQPPRALAVPASFPGPLLPAGVGVVGGALGLLGAEVRGGGTARGGAPRAVLSPGQASKIGRAHV